MLCFGVDDWLSSFQIIFSCQGFSFEVAYRSPGDRCTWADMASLSAGSAAALARTCDAVSNIYRNMRRRMEGPRLQTRAVAVLVWFLSSCPWLAVVYLQQRSFDNFDVSRDMATLELVALSLSMVVPHSLFRILYARPQLCNADPSTDCFASRKIYLCCRAVL